MREAVVKLIRRFVATLHTPEARVEAAQQMTTAWTKAGHMQKRYLRQLMQRRIAKAGGDPRSVEV